MLNSYAYKLLSKFNSCPYSLKVPLLLKLSPSSTVIRKVSKDFVSQLKNELGNSPSPSSNTLSAWFRSSTPSRSKNVLFNETISTGHFQGNSQKCHVTLTPQVITLVSNHFQCKTLHIIIDEVHLIQLDEFKTICTIFASNCQEEQPLSLENFAPGTVWHFYQNHKKLKNQICNPAHVADGLP